MSTNRSLGVAGIDEDRSIGLGQVTADVMPVHTGGDPISLGMTITIGRDPRPDDLMLVGDEMVKVVSWDGSRVTFIRGLGAFGGRPVAMTDLPIKCYWGHSDLFMHGTDPAGQMPSDSDGLAGVLYWFNEHTGEEWTRQADGSTTWAAVGRRTQIADMAGPL